MPLNPIEKSLVAGLLARVAVPSSGGIAETYFGRVKITAFPLIEVEFTGEKYPADENDDWVITVDTITHLISIRARVEARLKPNCFCLRVLGSQHHVQGRRHQRVEAEAYVRCFSNGEGSEKWAKPLKKKVDISPSGIRFFADGEFPLGEKIQVELFLLGPALEKVVFAGKVIRTSIKENAGLEVTVNITEIQSSDEEKITAFCMAQQFRNMKNKAEGLVSLDSQSLLSQ
jgi:PilZ domain